MLANFQTLLGLFLILLVVRPFRNDYGTIFKTILIMGFVGVSVKIVSFNTLTNWATGLNQSVGATAIAGSLVLVALNFVIQQSDIPFLPNNVEKAIRYVFYLMGGVLMGGSAEWGAFFTDTIGLLAGGANTHGILGIVTDLIKLLTLGLAGQ